MSVDSTDGMLVFPARRTAAGDPLFHLDELQQLDGRDRPPAMLDGCEMDEAAAAKASGNTHFQAGRWDMANDEYSRGLRVFGESDGVGAQRSVKATLCSNKAEALLKLQRWTDALTWASKALDLDQTNCKARFRRARALVEIGGAAELDEAAEELQRLKIAKPATSRAEQQLAQQISQQREALWSMQRRAATSLKHAFATGSGLGDASESEPVCNQHANVEPSTVASVAAGHQTHLWSALLEGWGEEERHAWLIDCYRTSVDDAKRRGELRGLALPRATPFDLLLDFLAFCKLAVARGVLPSPWKEWQGLLDTASVMLRKAFSPEHCNAHLRYGPHAGSGEALRRVAAAVYEDAAQVHRLERSLREVCCPDSRRDDEEGQTASRLTFLRAASIFADVGGPESWQTLLGKLT